MTGLRAARIQAGYKTAVAAHKKFARGKRGSEALSFSYFQLLEAKGPRLLNDPLARRFARFYGCSANLIYAWQAEPTTLATTEAPTFVTKGEDGITVQVGGPPCPTASHLSHRALAGARPDLTTGLRAGCTYMEAA